MLKFAAGLTVTGVLSFLLLEALKMVMVPVAAWLVGVVILILKVLMALVGLALVLLVVGGIIWFVQRRQAKTAEEV